MNTNTQKIAAATINFYARNAASFSATRQSVWRGWERVLKTMQACIPSTIHNANVFDIACGNMRFEQFLTANTPTFTKAYAIDTCVELLDAPNPHGIEIIRIQADVIELLERDATFASWGIPACNLVVAFGFMHHIPTHKLRTRLVRNMVQATKPGGLCALSFWQFEKDSRLANKAATITPIAINHLGLAPLDEGDRFLGWQDSAEEVRFCHTFSNAEVDSMRAYATQLGACVLDDFCADGSNNNLNRYLVMQIP